MQIANPIYDAVFEYLLQDDRAARLLISRTARMEVESVAPLPRDRGAADAPALFGADFMARVRNADETMRQVLFEIRKANTPTDVEIVRASLARPVPGHRIIEHPSGVSEAAPVVAVYFVSRGDLGYGDVTVLDVLPRVTERSTGAELDSGHPFVTDVCRRSCVVQIQRLKGRRRDDLERMLSVFDQGLVLEEHDRRLLSIDEEDYPQDCKLLLQRLREAATDGRVLRSSMADRNRLPRSS